VGYRRNHCLRGILGKKSKVVTCDVTTVSSINDGLTNRVPTLRDFETFGGYIVNF
jgi:hypothetical protein